jgi:membrane protease YdiL (CAAX protease family)
MGMQIFHTRHWRLLEIALLFVLLPLVLAWFLPSRVLFGVLWAMALYAWLMMRSRHVPHERPSILWDWPALRAWGLWKPILLRFVLAVPILIGVTYWLLPDRLFSFPLERPGIWLMVMMLYPILSVIPQEFLYRSFFFARYACVFTRQNTMIFASGLLFGYAHVVLLNWPAVLLSAVGGVYFSQTYAKRRSLALVCAEHALYGCFVFTVGLGWFFYRGGARAAQLFGAP